MLQGLLTGDPLAAFGALLLLTLIAHIAFMWLFPLGEVGCKRIDYAWLTLAALGLLSAEGNVRRLYAPGDMERARGQAGVTLEILRLMATGSHHCRRFERSEFSPANLDEVQIQQDSVCALTTRLARTLPASIGAVDSLVNVSFTVPEYLSDVVLRDDLQELQSEVAEYNGRIEEVRGAAAQSLPSEWEDTLTSLTPLLLAAALALRFTKVTIELRLLRARAAKA